MSQEMQCKICKQLCEAHFTAREMMFGMQDRFNYWECGSCGCLQIAEIPVDLDRYYPKDYYSFGSPTGMSGRLRVMPEWAKYAELSLSDKILDVGCGSGGLLVALKDYGFTELLGLDPFIEEDIQHANGVRVLKKKISELSGSFDFIMMHHAFEHMPEPDVVLAELSHLLRPGKLILIRIPVAASYAWKKYRTNWVQLDAPRHLFLHTRKSIEILAEQAGFSVERVKFDSWSFQFLGSEQYAKDIPLMHQNSFIWGMGKSIFSEADIRNYERESHLLNLRGEGDQAAFYLKKR